MTAACQPHYLVLEKKLRRNTTLLRIWLTTGAAATSLAAALL
ncbi:hypothetical protein [Hymenobacter gummosus]|nr:hypothetical protein [Hymenobacter gummosus]